MMIGNVDFEAVLIGETVGGCADQWKAMLMGKAVLRLCSLLMMLMGFADMLKGYDRYVTQWDTHSVVQYSLPKRYLLLRMLSQMNRDVFSSQPLRCTGITVIFTL